MASIPHYQLWLLSFEDFSLLVRPRGSNLFLRRRLMIRDSAYEKLILRFEYADGVLGRTSSGWECSEWGSLHWLDDSV